MAHLCQPRGKHLQFGRPLYLTSLCGYPKNSMDEITAAVQPQDTSLDVVADLSPRLRRVPHLLKGDRVTLRAYSQGDITAFGKR